MPTPWLATATGATLTDMDTVRLGIGATRVPEGAADVKNGAIGSSIVDSSLRIGSIASTLEAMPRVAVNEKASPAVFPFAIFATPRSG
jgi:hypothetical protein